MWIRWCLLLVILTTCEGLFFRRQRGLRARLIFSQVARGVVPFNSTVNGTCKVDGISDPTFNVSKLEIITYDGTSIPKEDITITSGRSIQFVIPKIQKHQFGLYKCVLRDGDQPLKYLGTATIHVVAQPLDISLEFVVYNWENISFEMKPSLEEQDRHMHDSRDRYIPLRTKHIIDPKIRCPVTGIVEMVDRNDSCAIPCRPSGCCPMNDTAGPRPSVIDYDATTCYGVKVWTPALGEPKQYNKIFKVKLEHFVKPSPISGPINIAITNSRAVTLRWPENAMWSIREERRVKYCVTFKARNFVHIVNRCADQPSLTETSLIPHGQYEISITVLPRRFGFRSEAVTRFITMPPDVPAKNPSFIGYTIDEIGEDVPKRWLTIYWQPLQEIDKNGPDVRTIVTLDGGTFCRPKTTKYSCRKKMHSTADQKANIYSNSSSHGWNGSASVPVMEIVAQKAPSVNLKVMKGTNGLHTFTWTPPSERRNLRASIVMCEKSTGSGCRATSPLTTLAEVDLNSGRHALDVVPVTSSPPRFGLVLGGGKYGHAIEWSRCVFEEGRTPVRPVAQVDKQPGQLLIHIRPYKCDEKGTGVLVPKVVGKYCQISPQDPSNCTGKVTDFEIDEFDEWKEYEVDAGLHMVRLWSEAQDGMVSQEWSGEVDVPAKATAPWKIALSTVIPIIAAILVGISIFWWIRKTKREEVSIKKIKPVDNSLDFNENPVPTSAPPSPCPSHDQPPNHGCERSKRHMTWAVPKVHKPTHCDDGYARVPFQGPRGATMLPRGDRPSCDDAGYARGGFQDEQDDEGTCTDTEDDATDDGISGGSESGDERTSLFDSATDNTGTSGLGSEGSDPPAVNSRGERGPDSGHEESTSQDSNRLGQDTHSVDPDSQTLLPKLVDDMSFLVQLSLEPSSPDIVFEGNEDEVSDVSTSGDLPGLHDSLGGVSKDSVEGGLPNVTYSKPFLKSHDSGVCNSYKRSLSETSAESTGENSCESSSGQTTQSKDGNYAQVTVLNPVFENSSLPTLEDCFGTDFTISV